MRRQLEGVRVRCGAEWGQGWGMVKQSTLMTVYGGGGLWPPSVEVSMPHERNSLFLAVKVWNEMADNDRANAHRVPSDYRNMMPNGLKFATIVFVRYNTQNNPMYTIDSKFALNQILLLMYPRFAYEECAPYPYRVPPSVSAERHSRPRLSNRWRRPN